MSTIKSMVGLLAVAATMTGGAIALGGVVGSADAATVMGGAPGGGRPAYHRVYRPAGNYNANSNRARAGNKNKNKNKQKNKQNQHHRQYQNQRQFLMRDFTLVLTPFQKSENGAAAVPWNHQWQQSTARPYSNQSEWSNTKAEPRQQQDTDVDTDNRNKDKNENEDDHRHGHGHRYPVVYETDAAAPEIAQ